MKRKFYNNLLIWKENYIKMPLMLVGARQVGKTYLLEEFAKENFDNYLYVNLEKEKSICEIFNNTINPAEIIEQMEFILKTKIDTSNTVIFFDEIQVSEKAICSLKYFCEDKIPYKIICAGSLLGVAINRFSSSFPVGKVYIEYLYPMDFEEFLMAINEDKLNTEIKKSFDNNMPMKALYHEEAIRLLHDFLIVGGMPNSVIEYINSDKKTVMMNEAIKANIITSYIADMTKYTTSSESLKINEIYNSIPAQLGRENKKFVYGTIKNGARSDRYKSSLAWLIDSNLVLKCNLAKLSQIPLKAYENLDIFKVYLSDTGLLSTLININDSKIFKENIMFKGMILENYVAINLKRNGFNLNFWESDATAKVDFIIEKDSAIIPIEVKASDNTKSKSLSVYRNKYNPKISYRVSTKNFGIENNIRSIPLYAVHLITKK